MLNGRRAPQLGDLDDHTLLACFSHLTPLPDLFNVAASCRRFRDLALDRSSWLFVTRSAAPAAAGALASPPPARGERQQHAAPPARAASTASLGSSALLAVDDSPHWYRSRFASLADAVAASRPGDTILLEAGPEPHVVEAPVVVPHPLHILGGGGEAADCTLVGARGIEALLDFRASGRVANLTLRATAGACVAHTRGRLTVQGCTLDCDARGLPHLAAPLVTRATSAPLPPPTPGAAGAKRLPAAPAGAGLKRPNGGDSGAWGPSPAAKRLRAWRSAAEAAAGVGVLSVAETRIKARGAAVDMRGSGQLSGVRAIYYPGHALVWLEVDSANARPAARGGAAAGAESQAAEAVADAPAAGPSSQAATAAAPAALPAMPLPSWLGRAAAAGFDAAAFSQRAALLAAPLAGACPQQQQQQQAQASGSSMERKAEEWCLLHHATLAPPAAADRPAPPPQAE